MSAQQHLTCLACGREFWTRRSYYRHKASCGRDLGERVGSGPRPSLSPDELLDEADCPEPPTLGP